MGKKQDNRKTTNLTINVEFEEGRHASKASVHPNGDITFFDENGVEVRPKSLKREMHHDRAKGRKIRTSQALENGKGAFSGLQQLAKFDIIFAIDTNTADVGGKRVCVTGIMPFSLTPTDEGFRVESHEDHVQIYEFEGEPHKPELFAILKLVFDLVNHAGIGRGSHVVIVTDTELDSLDEFNARKKPIYADHFLPEGFTLMYASSDTGWEAPNKFIRICDTAAKQTIRERRLGDIPKAPFVPMEGFPTISVRVGRRNAVVTIVNPTVVDAGLRLGQKASLYGIKK